MAEYGKFETVKSNQFQVCCITMNMSDRLRLLACPPEVISAIRQIIQQTWGNIQNERAYHGSHEFKLQGYPWNGQGGDAVSSRRLLVGILTVMARHGWNILQSSDVSKKPFDKDSMFFVSGTPDPQASLFALSFNMTDRIRVIDAPGFMPYMKDAVTKYWPPGIQNEREYNGSLELKLCGNPWHPDGSETVYSKLLLAQIIATFLSLGYKLYASVDISCGGTTRNHQGSDLESWVFRKMGQHWH